MNALHVFVKKNFCVYKNNMVFFLYLLYFLDLAGISIVYVIFPELFLSETPLYFVQASLSTRKVMLGIMFAIYPLAQCFGAPLLGAFSDRRGRKPILLLSSFFTTVSFLLTGFCIVYQSYNLLLLSRLMGGFSAGNLTVAQASVIDIIPIEKRSRYMPIFTLCGGVSWVFGSWLSMLFPISLEYYSFYIMGACFFIVFVVLMLFHKETLAKKKEDAVSLAALFKDLFTVFEHKHVSSVLLCSILATFGWWLYQGFFTSYLLLKFSFSALAVQKVFLFLSFLWFLGSLCCVTFLFRYIRPGKTIIICSFVSALAILSFYFYSGGLGVWFSCAVSNFCFSIVLAAYFSTFSVIAKPEVQGKIFGLWNSGWALSGALTSPIALPLSTLFVDLPNMIAAILIIITGIWFIVWYRKKRKEEKAYI